MRRSCRRCGLRSTWLPTSATGPRRRRAWDADVLFREREAARRLAELASFALPCDLPYLELVSLATEARQKLDVVRPTSLAQAARIPGVSPSDLHNLVVEATRWRRRQVA